VIVRRLAAAALLSAAAMSSGCAAAAAIGAAEAISIGAGAADVGSSVYKSGKLYSVQMAPFEDVVQAAYRAAHSMSLGMEKEVLYPHRAFIRFEDDLGKTAGVRIQRRTEILTFIRIDVGAFGSGPFARLFLRRMTHELAKMGVYPDGTENHNAE
jgi:hypothetical protein